MEVEHQLKYPNGSIYFPIDSSEENEEQKESIKVISKEILNRLEKISTQMVSTLEYGKA